jgi:hypothetical protein
MISGTLSIRSGRNDQERHRKTTADLSLGDHYSDLFERLTQICVFWGLGAVKVNIEKVRNGLW